MYQILWNNKESHYFLNAGAYDHEEEIILMDGAVVIVESVEKVIDNNRFKR